MIQKPKVSDVGYKCSFQGCLNLWALEIAKIPIDFLNLRIVTLLPAATRDTIHIPHFWNPLHTIVKQE